MGAQCNKEGKIYGLINIILMGFMSFLSLLIYFYLFQSTIRVLNINKLYSWDSRDFYLSFLQSKQILICLKTLLLLVQNLGGSHPTHATIRRQKARQRMA